MGSVTKIMTGFLGEDLFGGNDAAKDAARAQIESARMAIDEHRRASAQGLGFLEPFGQIGQRAVELSSFLADPQAQADFLQNNPIFQLGLENLNQQTNQMAAAKGRLSAGDTLAQLQSNAMLAAQPLLDRQRQDIGNLLNLGTGIAQSQANTAIGTGSNVANLLTDIGAARAGGIIGQANAQQQGISNILQLGAMALPFFSDSRLKSNAEKIDHKNGFDIWSWEWNEVAKEKFGLQGKATGVMVSDVLEKKPDAVSIEDGFAKVDYKAIGVTPSWQ